MWDLPEKKINDRFYKVDQSVLEKFKKEFGVNDESIEKTVEEIIKWAKEQPELPKESRDPEFVNNVFALCKYNEAKSKKMISSYFKTIIEYSQIFGNIHKYHQTDIDYGYTILMEKLTNAGERALIVKINLGNTTQLNLTHLVMTSIPFYLLNSHYTGVIPVRIIFDFTGMSSEHFKNFDYSMLFKYTSIYRYGLKYRVNGIHLLNTPSFVEKVLGMFKLIFTPKLYDRLMVHDKLESLYEYVPKEILPKEYGGPQYTCEEMKNTSNLLSAENRDFFDKIISFVPKNISSDTVFGAEGTFKTLTLD